MDKIILAAAAIGIITINPTPIGVKADSKYNAASQATTESRIELLALSAQPKIKADEKEIYLWITAYSSTPEETDDTPFITASGKRVRWGIVATNLLPFGTKIKIPLYFGDRIFVVEDRMNKRKKENIDIWMPSKKEAKKFGIHYAKIIIVD